MKLNKKFIPLFSLFIAFVFSLFLSPSVGAIEIVTNLTPVQTINVNGWVCSNAVNTSYSTDKCNISATASELQRSITSIRSSSSYKVVAGHYYEIYFSILSNQTQAGAVGVIWTIKNNDNFNFVSLEEVVDQTNPSYFEASYPDYGRQNQTFRLILQAKRDVTTRFLIGDGDTNSALILSRVLVPQIVYTSNSVTEYAIVPDASAEMNQKDDEDRDNIDSQQSDSQSSSDDSQAAAESTGTTLLGAFSSFVTAITSASPSNCRFDMDLGNLDLGNVDLCELDPPAGFSAIASIFLILFCVPLSISTARKVISLFRSFQG